MRDVGLHEYGTGSAAAGGAGVPGDEGLGFGAEREVGDEDAAAAVEEQCCEREVDALVGIVLGIDRENKRPGYSG